MLNYKFLKRTTPPYMLSIVFEPKLNFLAAYLFHIMDKNIYEWIKKGIEDVLTCKMEIAERELEWYGAKIQRENTIIYSTLELESLSPKMDIIKTEDFNKILMIWFQEKEKYDIEKKRLNTEDI